MENSQENAYSQHNILQKFKAHERVHSVKGKVERKQRSIKFGGNS